MSARPPTASPRSSRATSFWSTGPTRHVSRRSFLRLAGLAPLALPPVAPLAAAPAEPGAARWLAEDVFTASSLERGPIGRLEAWGGDEFGYAYSYSLSGEPMAVSVDRDSGLLSIGTPLAPGTYRFGATVRNRRDIAKAASFPIRLEILPGTREGSSTGAILHKDYVVDSGTYGSPLANDYTGVLAAIRRAIIADQKAAGDGLLRATILFRGGNDYDYADNRWPFGIQHLTIASDRPGVRAKLRNVAKGPADISLVILQIGRQYLQCIHATGEGWICDDARGIGRRIASTQAEARKVIIEEPGGTPIAPGRYVMIGSYDQQMGGFPPNIRYFDYARVTAVNGAEISLDRPLRFAHSARQWENDDPNSLGAARLYPIDRDDERLTLRASVRDIEFVANPHGNASNDGTKLYAAALEMDFENCVIPHLMVSQGRFARVLGGAVREGELDKLVGMVMFDRAEVVGLHEATGVEYLLLRGSTVTSGYGLAPRQMRILGSTLDGGRYAPLTFKGEWTTRQVEVRGSLFKGKGPAFSVWPAESLTIGEGVRWSGGRLLVSEHARGTAAWARAAWEGAIVQADKEGSGRWGLLTGTGRDGDDLAFEIAWKAGPEPGPGTKLLISRLHDLIVDAACRSEGPVWNDAGAVRQVTPKVTRPFPAGYPAARLGFGG